MSHLPELKFFDPGKHGTIIIGCPRFGTHFLEAVVGWKITEHAQDFERKNGAGSAPTYHRHFEIYKDPNDCDFIGTLEQYQNTPGYHTLIINSALPKIWLMTRPDILDRWHVIRVTHRDKMRWFLSWWLLFRHPQSEVLNNPPPTLDHVADTTKGFFLHHGTPQDVYERALTDTEPMRMNNIDVWSLQGSVSTHQISYNIPVDEQIDYADLRHLKGPWPNWKENQYPDIQLEQLITNADVVRHLLKVYDFEPPARFKEPK